MSKYGDTNTFKGRQTKQHGKTVKPAMTRYFAAKRWLENKIKRIKKNAKMMAKSKR